MASEIIARTLTKLRNHIIYIPKTLLANKDLVEKDLNSKIFRKQFTTKSAASF